MTDRRRAEFWGNENRARLSDSRNLPTDRDAGTSSGMRHDAHSVPGNDIFAPPVRGDAPIRVDPHANARHSNESRTVRPAEKSRAAYTSEIYDRKLNFRRTRT
jgi:hypothetical protein